MSVLRGGCVLHTQKKTKHEQTNKKAEKAKEENIELHFDVRKGTANMRKELRT